jgi:RNA polymerase sigma factor (sigma-70 family)
MTPNALVDLQPFLLSVARGDEDALQDANVKLLKVLVNGRTIRDLKHYAARAVRRSCLDAAEARRKERARYQPLTPAIERVAISPSDFDQVQDLDLHSAIDRLPDAQRDAIDARLSGNSVPQLAQHRAAANSMMHRALRSLRVILVA